MNYPIPELPHPSIDPNYCELFVDGVFLGHFHKTDPKWGLMHFISVIYDNKLVHVRSEGRSIHYRKPNAG